MKGAEERAKKRKLEEENEGKRRGDGEAASVAEQKSPPLSGEKSDDDLDAVDRSQLTKKQ